MANTDVEKYMSMLSLKKVKPYLYEVHYSDWDYSDGEDYYSKYTPLPMACSAVSSGKYIGRSFDWYYDDCAVFVVHGDKTNDRHGSTAIASGNKNLTDAVADSGEYNPAYKVLPFFTLDGKNDKNVFVETNVVPAGDKGFTTGTAPEKEDLCALMVARYLLDYADSAAHAITLLRNRNIFCPNRDGFTQEIHWMIRDENETYVVELINNQLSVLKSETTDEIVTNFYKTGFDGNTSTRFYKPSTYDADTTTLTAHAMGVERYDTLRDNISIGDTKDGMLMLTSYVEYTNAYSSTHNPLWRSEFTGDWETYGDLTVNSRDTDFDAIMSHERAKFNVRERGDGTWQTVYSAVYDITSDELWIRVQEESDVYRIPFNWKDRTDEGGLSYDLITNVFLNKTTGYNLYPLLPSTREDVVNGYMKRAISQFKKVCVYDLTKGDDEARSIAVKIPEDDIDEIVDIITEGMLVQWLKPFVYTSENLENLLNTNDYSQYSPAELLFRISGAYKDCQRNFNNMMKEYSYIHGDLTKLHT